MKTNRLGDDEISRDEQLISHLLGTDHKKSFDKHVEDATRNMSVNVHHASSPSQSIARYRVVIGVSVLAILAATMLFVVSNDDPLKNDVAGNDAVGTVESAPSSVEEALDADDYNDYTIINDIVEDESVDMLVSSNNSPTLIVSTQDVDLLLNGL